MLKDYSILTLNCNHRRDNLVTQTKDRGANQSLYKFANVAINLVKGMKGQCTKTTLGKSSYDVSLQAQSFEEPTRRISMEPVNNSDDASESIKDDFIQSDNDHNRENKVTCSKIHVVKQNEMEQVRADVIKFVKKVTTQSLNESGKVGSNAIKTVRNQLSQTSVDSPSDRNGCCDHCYRNVTLDIFLHIVCHICGSDNMQYRATCLKCKRRYKTRSFRDSSIDNSNRRYRSRKQNHSLSGVSYEQDFMNKKQRKVTMKEFFSELNERRGFVKISFADNPNQNLDKTTCFSNHPVEEEEYKVRHSKNSPSSCDHFRHKNRSRSRRKSIKHTFICHNETRRASEKTKDSKHLCRIRSSYRGAQDFRRSEIRRLRKDSAKDINRTYMESGHRKISFQQSPKHKSRIPSHFNYFNRRRTPANINSNNICMCEQKRIFTNYTSADLNYMIEMNNITLCCNRNSTTSKKMYPKKSPQRRYPYGMLVVSPDIPQNKDINCLERNEERQITTVNDISSSKAPIQRAGILASEIKLDKVNILEKMDGFCSVESLLSPLTNSQFDTGGVQALKETTRQILMEPASNRDDTTESIKEDFIQINNNPHRDYAVTYSKEQVFKQNSMEQLRTDVIRSVKRVTTQCLNEFGKVGSNAVKSVRSQLSQKTLERLTDRDGCCDHCYRTVTLDVFLHIVCHICGSDNVQYRVTCLKCKRRYKTHFSRDCCFDDSSGRQRSRKQKRSPPGISYKQDFMNGKQRKVTMKEFFSELNERRGFFKISFADYLSESLDKTIRLRYSSVKEEEYEIPNSKYCPRSCDYYRPRSRSRSRRESITRTFIGHHETRRTSEQTDTSKHLYRIHSSHRRAQDFTRTRPQRLRKYPTKDKSRTYMKNDHRKMSPQQSPKHESRIPNQLNYLNRTKTPENINSNNICIGERKERLTNYTSADLSYMVEMKNNTLCRKRNSTRSERTYPNKSPKGRYIHSMSVVSSDSQQDKDMVCLERNQERQITTVNDIFSSEVPIQSVRILASEIQLDKVNILDRMDEFCVFESLLSPLRNSRYDSDEAQASDETTRQISMEAVKNNDDLTESIKDDFIQNGNELNRDNIVNCSREQVVKQNSMEQVRTDAIKSFKKVTTQSLNEYGRVGSNAIKIVRDELSQSTLDSLSDRDGCCDHCYRNVTLDIFLHIVCHICGSDNVQYRATCLKCKRRYKTHSFRGCYYDDSNGRQRSRKQNHSPPVASYKQDFINRKQRKVTMKEFFRELNERRGFVKVSFVDNPSQSLDKTTILTYPSVEEEKYKVPSSKNCTFSGDYYRPRNKSQSRRKSIIRTFMGRNETRKANERRVDSKHLYRMRSSYRRSHDFRRTRPQRLRNYSIRDRSRKYMENGHRKMSFAQSPKHKSRISNQLHYLNRTKTPENINSNNVCKGEHKSRFTNYNSADLSYMVEMKNSTLCRKRNSMRSKRMIPNKSPKKRYPHGMSVVSPDIPQDNDMDCLERNEGRQITAINDIFSSKAPVQSIGISASDIQLDKVNILEKIDEFCYVESLLSPLTNSQFDTGEAQDLKETTTQILMEPASNCDNTIEFIKDDFIKSVNDPNRDNIFNYSKEQAVKQNAVDQVSADIIKPVNKVTTQSLNESESVGCGAIKTVRSQLLQTIYDSPSDRDGCCDHCYRTETLDVFLHIVCHSCGSDNVQYRATCLKCKMRFKTHSPRYCGFDDSNGRQSSRKQNRSPPSVSYKQNFMKRKYRKVTMKKFFSELKERRGFFKISFADYPNQNLDKTTRLKYSSVEEEEYEEPSSKNRPSRSDYHQPKSRSRSKRESITRTFICHKETRRAHERAVDSKHLYRILSLHRRAQDFRRSGTRRLRNYSERDRSRTYMENGHRKISSQQSTKHKSRIPNQLNYLNRTKTPENINSNNICIGEYKKRFTNYTSADLSYMVEMNNITLCCKRNSKKSKKMHPNKSPKGRYPHGMLVVPLNIPQDKDMDCLERKEEREITSVNDIFSNKAPIQSNRISASEIQLDKFNILHKMGEFCFVESLLSQLTNYLFDPGELGHIKEPNTFDIYTYDCHFIKSVCLWLPEKDLQERVGKDGVKVLSLDNTENTEYCTEIKPISENKNMSLLHKILHSRINNPKRYMKPNHVVNYNALTSFLQLKETMINLRHSHCNINNSNGDKIEHDCERPEANDKTLTNHVSVGHCFETGFEYDKLKSPVVLDASYRTYHIRDTKDDMTGNISDVHDYSLDVSTILKQVRNSDDILISAMESAGLSDYITENALNSCSNIDTMFFDKNVMNYFNDTDDHDACSEEVRVPNDMEIFPSKHKSEDDLNEPDSNKFLLTTLPSCQFENDLFTDENDSDTSFFEEQLLSPFSGFLSHLHDDLTISELENAAKEFDVKKEQNNLSFESSTDSPVQNFDANSELVAPQLSKDSFFRDITDDGSCWSFESNNLHGYGQKAFGDSCCDGNQLTESSKKPYRDINDSLNIQVESNRLDPYNITQFQGATNGTLVTQESVQNIETFFPPGSYSLDDLIDEKKSQTNVSLCNAITKRNDYCFPARCTLDGTAFINSLDISHISGRRMKTTVGRKLIFNDDTSVMNKEQWKKSDRTKRKAKQILDSSDPQQILHQKETRSKWYSDNTSAVTDHNESIGESKRVTRKCGLKAETKRFLVFDDNKTRKTRSSKCLKPLSTDAILNVDESHQTMFKRIPATEKMKSTETSMNTLLTSLEMKTQTINQEEGKSMVNFRRPKIMLNRRLKSRTSNRIKTSFVNSLSYPSSIALPNNKHFNNKNNNADSLEDSTSEISQSEGSSSSIKITDPHNDQLADRLKMRFKELEQQYRNRYQSPTNSSFGDLLSPTSVFQGGAQSSKSDAKYNTRRMKANIKIPKRYAQKQEDSCKKLTKSKTCVFNFVKRIQGSYGDQFPISKQTTKEKRLEICSKYLKNYGFNSLKVSQRNRNQRINKTNEREINYSKERDTDNGRKLLTFERKKELQLSEAEEVFNDIQSVTAVSSSERFDDISHNCYNLSEYHNEKHEENVKCMEIRSLSATNLSEDKSTNVTRSESLGSNLFMKLEKIEHNFQDRFKPVFVEASDTPFSSSANPKRHQSTKNSSNSKRKQKLLGILNKFEDLVSNSEGSSQTSEQNLEFEIKEKLELPQIAHSNVFSQKATDHPLISSSEIKPKESNQYQLFTIDSSNETSRQEEIEKSFLLCDKRKDDDDDELKSCSIENMSTNISIENKSDSLISDMNESTVSNKKTSEEDASDVTGEMPTRSDLLKLEGNRNSFPDVLSNINITDRGIKLPPLLNHDSLIISNIGYGKKIPCNDPIEDKINSIADSHSSEMRSTVKNDRPLCPNKANEDDARESVERILPISSNIRLMNNETFIDALQGERTFIDNKTWSSATVQCHQMDVNKECLIPNRANATVREYDDLAKILKMNADDNVSEKVKSHVSNNNALSGLELNALRSLNKPSSPPSSKSSWVDNNTCTSLSPIPEDPDEENDIL